MSLTPEMVAARTELEAKYKAGEIDRENFVKALELNGFKVEVVQLEVPEMILKMLGLEGINEIGVHGPGCTCHEDDEADTAEHNAMVDSITNERVDGLIVGPAPATMADWEALSTKTHLELLNLGLILWGMDADTNNGVYMLPHEWFGQVPDGLMVYTIAGHRTEYVHLNPETGEAPQKSYKFGALPFGIRGCENVEDQPAEAFLKLKLFNVMQEKRVEASEAKQAANNEPAAEV